MESIIRSWKKSSRNDALLDLRHKLKKWCFSSDFGNWFNLLRISRFAVQLFVGSFPDELPVFAS